MKNDNNQKESTDKIPHIFPFSFKMPNERNESKFMQKSKEYMKNKKAVSMKHIFDGRDKISININQSININANPNSKFPEPKKKENKKENDGNESKPQSEEGNKKKGIAMKSCILGLDSDRKKDKKTILSMNINRTKIKNRTDFDSSMKMEKLLEKQSKIDTKDDKKEQFIEFYINDNIRNKAFKLKDNTIITSKYNVFTFIPKGLLYQFSRLSNIYFLFTAIIQSIPLISPLTSLTAIIPLIFVLGVSMIREAIEDLSRKNYDNLNNKEEVIVLRDNKFVRAKSKTLKYGEIILVYGNKNIPADMILIDSGFEEGTCYVETSSLDGEKNLKLKVANKYTQGFISSDIKKRKGVTKLIHRNRYSFNGYVKINSPNIDLNYVNGTIHTLFQKDGKFIEEDIIISTNEFLLKGSVLKNTNWIIGIVVYTGMNNKIILNSKKPRLKMSKVEKQLNFFLSFVFIFLFVCCIICSIMHRFDYLANKKFYDNFILISNSPNTESFIIFFTYFLLLNTMIPISLIVSTEIIKMIQGIFIRWDVLLYSKWRKCFCSAKSVSIIEELGNVNFIFSDKTGTLTRNQLQFKFCIINQKFYKYIKHGNKNKNNSNNHLSDIFNKNNIKSIDKRDLHKHSLQNVFENANRRRIRNSEVYNKLDINKKKILSNFAEISSINDKEEIFNRNFKHKNSSYSNFNNIFNNSKLTLLKKINDMERNGIELLKNFDSNKSKKGKEKDNVSVNKSSKIKISSNKYNNQLNNSRINNSRNNISKIKNSSDCSSSSNSGSSSSNSIEKNNNNDISDINSKDSMHSSLNNFQKNFILIQKEGRNSTIFEIKGANNTMNRPIPFYEGYFSMLKNNPFLRNVSLYDGEDFNYIHEFWKALALTNECMIKEIRGEIKYMGTSPDDLELVKAAARQGYKLVETSVNSKTIRILGKDYSYEVLKVLGFSSERKRMSIIVRDKSGIKLYIKGADCEISKRLSSKSLENENFTIISKGLIEFSKKGLRTLMVAYRRIRQEDYDSWIKRLHEDELNIQSKQKMIDKLYDIIENNLILIGGTVVEDKLQDKVPETIKELRAAGIKIWVLTGDKLDTAENIGHSCNLLSKEQRLFTLKVMPGDDEGKVKEDPYPEMIQFFSEFQEFIDGLVKKYNLETKYSKKRKQKINNDNVDKYNMEIVSDFSSPEQNSSNNSNNSVKSKLIDFETFNYLKEKKILEPFSIIIEAPILCGLFRDEEWTENFLSIAYNSNTVICCRVSPSQKSQVIQKMKNFDKNAITLALGDGGNDVSMIMEANIGIGIYGEEGMSAAQASDFSIGEFKLLKRLLFIHGRINLYRISKMILYFFYKNFVFTMSQLYFSFNCLASGQTFIDDWYITCYNLIFTALPLCVSALTDSDIDIKDGKEKKNLAILYKENRDKYKIFSFPRFILRLIKGIIISLLIFLLCCFNEILNNGRNKNIWYLSLKTYTSILIVVSINLMMNSNYIVYLLPLSIGVTTFLFYGIFLIINHYGLLFDFNSKASIRLTFISPLTYLNIFLICSFGFIIDYTTKLSNIFFSGSLSLKLILRKALQSNRKSLYGTNKLFNSKSYSKSSRKRTERRNAEYDDRSKNNMMVLKSPKKSYNNIRFQECNTPKAFNNSKYKVGPDYKNDFFSLRLLKINNINNNKSNKKNNYRLDESND